MLDHFKGDSADAAPAYQNYHLFDCPDLALTTTMDHESGVRFVRK